MNINSHSILLLHFIVRMFRMFRIGNHFDPPEGMNAKGEPCIKTSRMSSFDKQLIPSGDMTAESLLKCNFGRFLQ